MIEDADPNVVTDRMQQELNAIALKVATGELYEDVAQDQVAEICTRAGPGVVQWLDAFYEQRLADHRANERIVYAAARAAYEARLAVQEAREAPQLEAVWYNLTEAEIQVIVTRMREFLNSQPDKECALCVGIHPQVALFIAEYLRRKS